MNRFFFKFAPTLIVIFFIVLSIPQIQVRQFLNQIQIEKVSLESINNFSVNHGGKSKKDLKKNYYYRPAETEKFVVEHLNELGLDETDPRKSKGCTPFSQHGADNNPLLSNHVISKFANYVQDLTINFTHYEQTFDPVHDIMKTIKRSSQEDIPNICKSLKPQNYHSIDKFFSNSDLSYSSRMGYMEPLLPPMRHPLFCKKGFKYVFSLDYLIHDFEAMCNSLTPYSKLIMIDMGADLARESGPVIKLLDLYSKFGFEFDHIYGYEMKFTDPTHVYKKQLPKKYMHSFHWINVAVEKETDSVMNPLTSILSHFDEDDFIVVKLDIDHGPTELPLARQIFESDVLIAKIDQFYFEHHVNMKEIAKYWSHSMNGTVKDSFELFHGLRKKGVASHFWV